MKSGKRNTAVLVAAVFLFGFNEVIADTFYRAASMASPHFGATATLLQDGRVLVLGSPQSNGTDFIRDSSSAEMYDPASDVWTQVAPDPANRTGHTATLLRSGDVLVVGGAIPFNLATGAPVQSLARVDRYTPSLDGWSPAENLPNVRSGHTATLLSDGRVAVIGGGSPTEVFDDASGHWTTFPDPVSVASNADRQLITPTAVLISHRSVLLRDGTVLVAGGQWSHSSTATGFSYVSTGFSFDPKLGSWSSTGPLNQPRVSHTLTLLADGRVLMAGGLGTTGQLNTTEIFDPTTGTWKPAAALKMARWGHSATLLPDGRVLVVGGETSGSTTDRDVLPAEVYDPATDTWAFAAASPANPRFQHTATLLHNGEVLLAGGQQWTGVNLIFGPPGTATAERFSMTSPRRAAIEYYRAGVNHYFISSLPTETAKLDAMNTLPRLPPVFPWQRTLQSFNVFDTPVPGTTPVCRFYIPPAFGDSHFFSASPAECAAVKGKFPQLVLEADAAFYIFLPDAAGTCPADTLPVYRVWNNAADSNHRYTTDRATRDDMVSAGGIAEGYGRDNVAMCAPQHP